MKWNRAVTVPDFHYTIILAKQINNNNIIAISTVNLKEI